MTTFLHTADIHLNALREFDGFLGRAEKTLNRITEIAVDHQVDLVVVAGDVYHSRSITHLERQLLSNWLGSCPVPVIAISGNHEVRSEDLGDTTLSYLSKIRHKNHLVYDGAPTVLKKKRCYFILFPYVGWTNTEFNLLLEAVLEQIPSNNLPIVVVMHEYLRGAKTDSGYVKEKDDQIVLIENKFPRVTYWALGDVHKCQRILPNAWYSGAPHQTRFDETLPKGVLLVDTDNPTKPEVIPIDSIPLLKFNKLPKEIPTSAFVDFEPETLADAAVGDLPPNVRYHPNAKLFKNQRGTSLQNLELGLFSQLDDYLDEAGLSHPMKGRSWRYLKQIGSKMGVKVPIPKQYRKKKRKKA